MDSAIAPNRDRNAVADPSSIKGAFGKRNQTARGLDEILERGRSSVGHHDGANRNFNAT
jgi:hypothetical protein